MDKPAVTGFLSEHVELHGEEYPYVVYVPADYTSRRRWPAILFLHGAGERGTEGRKQAEVGIGKAIRENPERFPCLVVMPQCRPGRKWDADMRAMAGACLDAVQEKFNIDPGRIALTGLSLGGFGTWAWGAEEPGRFCALGPICGGGDTGQALNLARTPIWCFHGDADPVVPVDQSREMVAAIRVAGGDVTYSELPGVGHNAWDAAYGNPKFIAWLLRDRR